MINGEAWIASLQETLIRDAEQLGATRPVPIDLHQLLDELGISLVVERPSGRSVPHGSLHRNGLDWQIVVTADVAGPRRRYSIAHELAHYMIEARVGLRPSSGSEYWRIEELCQEFAAALLAPRAVVRSVLKPLPSTPSGLIRAAKELAARTDLSIEAASRRVVEAAGFPVSLAAFSLESRTREPSDGVEGARILWLHSSRPWVIAGRGKVIRSQHPLAPAASRAQAMSVGEEAFVDLEGALSVFIERRSPGQAFVAAFLATSGNSLVSTSHSPE